jgi:hypothetical protein
MQREQITFEYDSKSHVALSGIEKASGDFPISDMGDIFWKLLRSTKNGPFCGTKSMLVDTPEQPKISNSYTAPFGAIALRG